MSEKEHLGWQDGSVIKVPAINHDDQGLIQRIDKRLEQTSCKLLSDLHTQTVFGTLREIATATLATAEGLMHLWRRSGKRKSQFVKVSFSA